MEMSDPLPTSAKKRSRSEVEDDNNENLSGDGGVPVGPQGLASVSCHFS